MCATGRDVRRVSHDNTIASECGIPKAKEPDLSSPFADDTKLSIPPSHRNQTCVKDVKRHSVVSTLST